jgi:hypothetical protein
MLLAAAEQGSSRAVGKLLVAGADANWRKSEALRLAVSNGHARTVEVLLAHGANPRVISENELRWAAWEGFHPVIRAIRQATSQPTSALQ